MWTARFLECGIGPPDAGIIEFLRNLEPDKEEVFFDQAFGAMEEESVDHLPTEERLIVERAMEWLSQALRYSRWRAFIDVNDIADREFELLRYLGNLRDEAIDVHWMQILAGYVHDLDEFRTSDS